MNAFRDIEGERVERREPQAPTNKPTIKLEPGEIERAVDEIEGALMTSDRGLFQRGGLIVAIEDTKLRFGDGHEQLAPRIVERIDHALREDICASVHVKRCRKEKNGDLVWFRIDPPMEIVKTLRGRGHRLRLPVLNGLINAPTLRSNGSILFKPGYDEQTGLFYAPGKTVFPLIPEKPTRADGQTALSKLQGLISTFPFERRADDGSVALSAMLTAIIRPMLPSAPLHGFGAPVAGSGKSLLVDIICTLATGNRAPVIAQGRTQEEFEKRLGALFLSGAPVVAIDNCESPLGGEFLCQVLTQRSVCVRILGKSEAPELPTNALITATGNNLVIEGDMTRRALLCTLDPRVEKPELRTFENDPIADAVAHRGELVVAALTVLRAYHAAGCPKQCEPLGSFEVWSNTVRSALIWLGCADPVLTMEKVSVSDPRKAEARALMETWQEVIGVERVTVRQVIDKAAARLPGVAPSGFVHPDFREALLVVAGRDGVVNSRALGRWLGSHKDRIVGDRRFREAGLLNGSMTWRLVTGDGNGVV